jgi:hypothetical protein
MERVRMRADIHYRAVRCPRQLAFNVNTGKKVMNPEPQLARDLTRADMDRPS